MYNMVSEFLNSIMGTMPDGQIYLLINDVLTFCLCCLPFYLAYKVVKSVFNAIFFA